SRISFDGLGYSMIVAQRWAEVAPIKDTTLSDLCPLLGLCYRGKCCGLRRVAFTADLHAVDQLTIFPGASFNGCHARISHDQGDTSETCSVPRVSQSHRCHR